MIFNNTVTVTNIETWFIPVDILMIVCTVSTVLTTIFFLITIIFDKNCHSIPMMLIANSCLAEFIFASDMLAMTIFTLHNDLKQIHHQDSLCIFRGFLGYIVTSLQNYSYLLQAIYRYIIVVYPTHLFYQSTTFQSFLICLTWIFAFVCPIPYLVTNEIQYNMNNQICQMPLRLSFLTIYNALCVYMIPTTLTALIYFQLIRYVREMNDHVNTTNTFIRAKRELKMVRRIVILIVGVTTIGFPYALFVFLSLFTNPPRYHFRIAYIFVDVSLVFVMIALFKFTEPLQTSIMKKINRHRNAILPAIT